MRHLEPRCGSEWGIADYMFSQNNVSVVSVCVGDLLLRVFVYTSASPGKDSGREKTVKLQLLR